jgi:hypothetical protein
MLKAGRAGLGLGLAVMLLSMAPARGQDADVSDSPYYPMAVGTQWKYRVTAGGQENTIEAKITKHEEMGGVKCAVLEGTAPGGGPAGVEHIRPDKEGIRRYAYNGVKVDPAVQFVKLPAKVGDKWDGKVSIGGQEIDFKYETTAIDQEVKVPAGTYKAVAVRTQFKVPGNDQEASITIYYAPGVGPVKQELSIGGMDIPIELVEFTKGGGDEAKKDEK